MSPWEGSSPTNTDLTRGTAACANTPEGGEVHVQVSKALLSPQTPFFLFGALLMKNTCKLKMFSLRIHFFYLTEVKILVPIKHAVCL